jgi:valyl-tRNA synthetase
LTLQGVDRFAGRKKIVERLEAAGLVEKIEPHSNAVPHGDRSNVVIEPFLTDQWYVNAKKLAEPAIAAVREGKTTFVPKNWEKTYFDWMENIQPWCISRQLWWGHQIPAWYGPELDERGREIKGKYKIFVAETEARALGEAKTYYGSNIRVSVALTKLDWGSPLVGSRVDASGDKVISVELSRDQDVLDTWFSSALWPFSTLGWPDETKELKRFYPTSALVTGFDIIFFWVARMMMMGLHFMPDVPFHDIYIHRLVRDASGAKMSKSKGNVVDPLGVIDEFGADALRFTLARNVAPGHDIRLGPQDVENNRNFATKLWNAARFAEMNGAVTVLNFDPDAVKQTVNRWIVHETRRAVIEVTEALSAYRFNDAANAAYRFVWNIYCDWYLELTKLVLSGIHGPVRAETSATVCWVRDEVLKLLHPFMPFITEELWRVTAPRTELLALSRWPITYRFEERGRVISWTRFVSGLRNTAFKRGLDFGGEFSAVAEIGFIVGLIEEIRSSRREFDIPGGAVALVRAIKFKSPHKKLIAKYHKEIFRLSRTLINPFHSKLVISDDPEIPENVVIEARNQEFLDHVVLPYREGQLLLHGIDRDSQRAKYEREMSKADVDIARCDAKLNNPKFMERAAEEVVEEEKEKREEAVGRKAKIAEALERLKGAT